MYAGFPGSAPFAAWKATLLLKIVKEAYDAAITDPTGLTTVNIDLMSYVRIPYLTENNVTISMNIAKCLLDIRWQTVGA